MSRVCVSQQHLLSALVGCTSHLYFEGEGGASFVICLSDSASACLKFSMRDSSDSPKPSYIHTYAHLFRKIHVCIRMVF